MGKKNLQDDPEQSKINGKLLLTLMDQIWEGGGGASQRERRINTTLCVVDNMTILCKGIVINPLKIRAKRLYIMAMV